MAASTYKISGEAGGSKLGQRHWAYLRAVAEGVPMGQAAARYLGSEADKGLPALRRQHKALVDQVQAQLRRRGEPGWRLVGLVIKPLARDTPSAPPIDVWAETLGLTDFGHAELLALHAEAFPQDRFAQRDSRLRKRQLALLQDLATTGSEAALPHHRLDEWLPGHLCRSLQAVGLVHLADLQTRIQAGGRWWAGIPKIGAGKAERLQAQMALLLPGLATLPSAVNPADAEGPVPPVALRGAAWRAALQGSAWPAMTHQDPALAHVQTSAPASDAEAIARWIVACAGSAATIKSYRRELGRFMLYLDQQGLGLADCQSDDCRAYLALLKDPPAPWTGKRTAPVGHAAWRPFAGPLSERSQQHAAAVLATCFKCLAATGHLPHNPWAQQHSVPAGQAGPAGSPGKRGPSSAPIQRGLPDPWRPAILDRLGAWAITEPGAERTVFVLHLLDATGLRAQELLACRLADLQCTDGQWLLQVHGPGRNLRQLPLSKPAQAALDHHLATRGLALTDLARHADLPLLANLRDPKAPLSYRPLYGSLKTWLGKAIGAAGLAESAQQLVMRISPLGLRLASASQALDRGMPVAQAAHWLGHAHARTTAKYRAEAPARAAGPAPDKAPDRGWNGSTPLAHP